MKIQQDMDIESEARREISELPSELDRPSFLVEAIDILKGWLAFIDAIQSQRENIVHFLKGFQTALEVLKPGEQIAPDSPIKTAPPHSRRDVAGRIRKSAKEALRSTSQWLPSSQLADTVGLYDNALEGTIDSSTVSAAMQYGVKTGEFITVKHSGKRMWGLPEWRENQIDNLGPEG